MEVLDLSWQEMLERVTEKVLYLENITESINQELTIQRAIREEWASWNESWKSAWLFSEDEESRLATSIRLRIHDKKKSFPNT
ncbi:MAG: hypothetical protein JJT78_13480 [Leptospira sp.]|nr:hypothetical protein [Leptospira sp.]